MLDNRPLAIIQSNLLKTAFSAVLTFFAARQELPHQEGHPAQDLATALVSENKGAQDRRQSLARTSDSRREAVVERTQNQPVNRLTDFCRSFRIVDS